MRRYLVKRGVYSFLLLFLLSLVLFALCQSMPGDRVDAYLGIQTKVSAAERLAMKEYIGLDASFLEQYTNWIKGFFSGDLGVAFSYKQEVFPLILSHLANTLLLQGSAFVLALGFAVPLSLHRSFRDPRWKDKLLDVIWLAGLCIPPFFLSLLLMFLVKLMMPAFPISGMRSINAVTLGYEHVFMEIGDVVLHMIIPCFVLLFGFLCVMMPYFTALVKEEERKGYLMLAKATGTKRVALLYHHILRNTAVPMLQLIGMYLPAVFSGALIIEHIFSWSGMGSLLLSSLEHREWYLSSSILLLLAVVIVLSSFLVDVLCMWIHPMWKEDISYD